MSSRNRHATACVTGETGVMILGASGAGKTALALRLVARARAAGCHGALVADDQLFLDVHGGRLVASAPAPIAGLAEFRGPGPLPVVWLSPAVIDAVVELVEPEAAPRLDDAPPLSLLGLDLPRLRLSSGDIEAAAGAAEAWLESLAARRGASKLRRTPAF